MPGARRLDLTDPDRHPNTIRWAESASVQIKKGTAGHVCPALLPQVEYRATKVPQFAKWSRGPGMYSVAITIAPSSATAAE